MCVDYRALNARTVRDAYALPRIDEVLDALAGAKYFSVLDMKSGYYQVEVAEEHKERTAFTVGPLGFWEHNRLPFGICNAPATYQRLMEDAFCDLHLNICFIYIDDLIIFSDTYEQHMERLDNGIFETASVWSQTFAEEMFLFPGESQIRRTHCFSWRDRD